MADYKLMQHTGVIRKSDGAFIPFDERNMDYQYYLQWLGHGYTPDPADTLTQAELIAKALLQIDVETDAVYGAVLGNRAQEYTLAESDASAYKDAGYNGVVPASVQCWATAKNWTAKAAADEILATSLAWRTAQAEIRAQRLLIKENVRATTNQAAIDSAMVPWGVFVAAIRLQLGV